MKHTIDFNEHLDAQARAYEIGKAEGFEQAKVNAKTGKPCCGNFESCCTPCVPRAEHFKGQRDQLMDVFARTEFREAESRYSSDYGVKPADIARISSLCKAIRNGQTS